MDEILHANIFFIITTVAVVVFTILVCLVLYQILRITKSIRRMIQRIEASGNVIADDIDRLRSFVVEGGMISHIISMFVKSNRSRSDED